MSRIKSEYGKEIAGGDQDRGKLPTIGGAFWQFS